MALILNSTAAGIGIWMPLPLLRYSKQVKLFLATGNEKKNRKWTTNFSIFMCVSAENNNKKKKKRCLRCNTLYLDKDNSLFACSFHGHVTGEKGLFALSPPHQGIDGEWTDRSGVIVYKWNEKGNRPNSGGSANWKKRWSCCAECDENAPPCRRGWHVSYDDDFTLY